MIIKIKKISNIHFELSLINEVVILETRELLTKDFLKHDFTHIALLMVLPIKTTSLFEYPEEIERLAGCLHDLSESEGLQTRIDGVANIFEAYGQTIPFNINIQILENIRQEYLSLKSKYQQLKSGVCIELKIKQ